jgi:Ca2+:H+ antiporter
MRWPHYLPLLCAGVLVAGIAAPLGPMLLLACGAALLAAVISAVHHAEVIAHRTGEPLGTFVLALAVTVIEAALVISIMLAGGINDATVARDTVYAAVMIICNGVVGICLLLGGIRHVQQSFRIEGTGSGLAALATLSTLVLVAPTLTISAPVGAYTHAQLVFVALSSLTLWLVFVFIQTVRHRDYFLPDASSDDESIHAPPPGIRAVWTSSALLIVSLVGVVGLAKVLSPGLERAVVELRAPRSIVGILIAMIVLLPETVAAVRAARANRFQTSMNLAFGSAMASIGLTIPVVVAAAVALHLPLTLGLGPMDIALLALTFVVGSITLGSGRTNIMQGAIHLVIFAAFLILTLVP